MHDAVDVGETTKDAEYCANLAKTSILSAEEKYGCKVIAFVSDSENKMVKVREILQDWRGMLFICYGCSAHAVSLAQESAASPAICAHITEVQKFYRNHQKLQAKLKSDGGKTPQLAGITR